MAIKHNGRDTTSGSGSSWSADGQMRLGQGSPCTILLLTLPPKPLLQTPDGAGISVLDKPSPQGDSSDLHYICSKICCKAGILVTCRMLPFFPLPEIFTVLNKRQALLIISVTKYLTLLAIPVQKEDPNKILNGINCLFLRVSCSCSITVIKFWWNSWTYSAEFFWLLFL